MKPTIAYKNGRLTFNCETEGATCLSSITDPDITSYSSDEVQLGVTYNISVYTVDGHMDGSVKACDSQTSLVTNLRKGDAAIIKIGEKSVKVIMQ